MSKSQFQQSVSWLYLHKFMTNVTYTTSGCHVQNQSTRNCNKTETACFNLRHVCKRAASLKGISACFPTLRHPGSKSIHFNGNAVAVCRTNGKQNLRIELTRNRQLCLTNLTRR